MIRLWTKFSETTVSYNAGVLRVETPERKVELDLRKDVGVRDLCTEIGKIDPTLSVVFGRDERRASELVPGTHRITPKGFDWNYADEVREPESDFVFLADPDDMTAGELAQVLAGME